MKQKYVIISIIIIVLIAGGIIYFFGDTSKNSEKIRLCDNINRNPPELTFELSYCQGDMCAITCDENGENCHSVTTEDECEKIDVIASNDISKFDQDGKADCEWINNRCIPNK